MAAQLPVQFEFNTQQAFSNFYPGPNAEIVSHLQQAIAEANEQFIYIWGDTGRGKTHLLQAACQHAHELKKTGFIFSLQADKLPPVRLLENLEDIDWVCIDNIDYITGNPEWEQAFFHFFNQHRDQDKHLLLSANCPPNLLTVELPDLKTRLNWGLTLKLQALTDEDCIAALKFKAASLGLALNNQVGNYLLRHYARDLPSLWRLMDELDRASLAAKRKLTLPFLRQWLNESN